MAAKLPMGPPKLKVTISFTPREMEFIALRYVDCLQLKEIAERMGVSLRAVKEYSTLVIRCLGLHGTSRPNVTALQVMKLLLKHKIISA